MYSKKYIISYYYSVVDSLMATLKPHSSGSLYSSTVIGTLAVDGWAVIFPRCTKCNSPPINGQCTNFILLSASLYFSKRGAY